MTKREGDDCAVTTRGHEGIKHLTTHFHPRKPSSPFLGLCACTAAWANPCPIRQPAGSVPGRTATLRARLRCRHWYLETRATTALPLCHPWPTQRLPTPLPQKHAAFAPGLRLGGDRPLRNGRSADSGVKFGLFSPRLLVRRWISASASTPRTEEWRRGTQRHLGLTGPGDGRGLAVAFCRPDGLVAHRRNSCYSSGIAIFPRKTLLSNRAGVLY